MTGFAASSGSLVVSMPVSSFRPEQVARAPFDMRRSARMSVALGADLRTGTGLRDTSELRDLSCEGCRIVAGTLFMAPGQRLVIRLDGLEGLTGIIRWIDGQCAGVEFTTPLYVPVLEHIVRRHGALVA